MNTIASIYLKGLVFPASSQAYDPSQPQKNWVYPILAWPVGATPSGIFTYSTVDTVTAAIGTNSITYEAAATANMETNTGVPSTTPVNQSSVPIPVDLTQLPAGAAIVANPMAIFGQLPLIQLAAALVVASGPPAPVEDPHIVRILNGVNAILVRLGLAQV